ncbi:hypothetical protein CLAIMM_08975 isoform 1 [Cladophialophora immunda]|nr:hypothetical protein CLAIMM_08975 isoform 1 [Cladophialophora immunda]
MTLDFMQRRRRVHSLPSSQRGEGGSRSTSVDQPRHSAGTGLVLHSFLSASLPFSDLAVNSWQMPIIFCLRHKNELAYLQCADPPPTYGHSPDGISGSQGVVQGWQRWATATLTFASRRKDVTDLQCDEMQHSSLLDVATIDPAPPGSCHWLLFF